MAGLPPVCSRCGGDGYSPHCLHLCRPFLDTDWVKPSDLIAVLTPTGNHRLFLTSEAQPELLRAVRRFYARITFLCHQKVRARPTQDGRRFTRHHARRPFWGFVTIDIDPRTAQRATRLADFKCEAYTVWEAAELLLDKLE